MYRNVHVHDIVLGTHAVQWREELRREIEEHMDMGENKLKDHNKYILEFNLEELDSRSANTKRIMAAANKGS